MRASVCGLMLLVLATPVRAADDLGRLFFTPEQRSMLDLARRTQPSAADTASEEYDGVTLNGIVVRSDGKGTAWINGRPQHSGAGAGYRVNGGRAPTSASIPLPGAPGRVRLKVGQTLDPASGKVEEGYRRPRPSAAPETKPAESESKPAAPKPKLPATEANGDDDQVEDALAPSAAPAR